jgi:hypothetical protein
MINQGKLFVIKDIQVEVDIIRVDLATKSIDGSIMAPTIKLCRAPTIKLCRAPTIKLCRAPTIKLCRASILLTIQMAGIQIYTINYSKTT